MKIFGLSVGRNEENRYLRQMLLNLKGVFDEHFFFDDQSLDKTPAIAEEFGCVVVQRTDDVPTFERNEGMFRGAAWQAFEQMFSPSVNDWVCVIDCDEFLATKSVLETRVVLENVCAYNASAIAIDLNIIEVFGWDHQGQPLQRVDNQWGTIHAPRLFQYRAGGSYFVGEMAVPAVPNYVMGASWASTDALALLHFGYAKETDRHIKYRRYSNNIGHSLAHVESIIHGDKKLISSSFKGQVPWNQLM